MKILSVFEVDGYFKLVGVCQHLPAVSLRHFTYFSWAVENL